MRGWLASGVLSAAIASSIVAIDFGRPRSVLSAEYLQIGLGLFSATVPVEALETFATTGQVPEELDTYFRYIPIEAQERFREVLNRRFEVSPVAVSQVTYASIGEDFLNRLGQIIQTPSGINGKKALRAALILAATDPEGMSVLSILKQFPTQGIHIDAGELLALQSEISSYFSYRDAALEAIRAQSEREITEMPLRSQDTLPNLTTRGNIRFEQTTLRLRNQFPSIPEEASRIFEVDLYTPQESTAIPAPLVVISHGLGSNRDEFSAMAEHLASYGFAVAVPEHPGSNTTYRQEFLANLVYEGINPNEFIYRPWDVKTIINVLAAEPAYAQAINLEEVGVIGHSFGGYTALALAGAPLNFARIDADCNPVEYVLNLSTLLQCRAAELPRGDYDLADERIAAVTAYNPITSVLLGPESLSQIQVPVMIVTGTADFVAPAVPEQIHPFVWLEGNNKYLATFFAASHVSINGEVDFPDQVDISPQVASLLTGPAPEQSTDYAHVLNAAFMGFHLGDRPGYEQFLGAGYAAQFLSKQPVMLRVISQLTSEQLQSAYSQAPPIPVYPEPVLTDAAE